MKLKNMYNILLERYSGNASVRFCCIKIHAEMTEVLQLKIKVFIFTRFYIH